VVVVLSVFFADPDTTPRGDLIDGLAGLAGVTIRVRHELPDASMRLMRTLGVHVEITPDAPRCAPCQSKR
jgi:hypothetical protein